MYARRRLSCPGFFHPSTNRRMYRLLSRGLIGALRRAPTFIPVSRTSTLVSPLIRFLDRSFQPHLEVRVSPVYLTQVFQQVEGVPLYRYQLRLRLARALDLLAQYDDLTSLSLELGFSSHSHFSAAFRQAYGYSPSEFRQSALRR